MYVLSLSGTEVESVYGGYINLSVFGMIERESANLRNLIELVDVAVDVRPMTHVPETGNKNRYQKMVPVFQGKGYFAECGFFSAE